MKFLRWIWHGGRIARYLNLRDEPTTNPAFLLLDEEGQPSVSLALDETTWFDRFVYRVWKMA